MSRTRTKQPASLWPRRYAGGVVRYWGDFRRLARWGGSREPLVAQGESRATTDPTVAQDLFAKRLAQLTEARKHDERVRVGYVTLADLFALYLQHRTPRKTPGEQSEDSRRVRLWTRHLGAGKNPAKLTRQEWEAFTALRAVGELSPRGEAVAPEKRRTVRPRSVQRDLLWLKWVLNWATTWQNAEGQYLLPANPVRGFEVPSEKNPRRPVASTDRLEKVLAAAATLEMELRWGGEARRQRAYLADVLVLAAETGRRISPVLALRWDDVLWEAKPHGAIRWRADEDKQGREWVTPVSPKVRATLERLREERPGIGSALLFPSPTNAAVPVSYERCRHWLLKAEAKAKVPKQEGGSFHPYRRAWATTRKHLPLVDVAAAGGWKSTAVLLRHYQQPDEETLLRVVLGGAELRERKA